MALKIIIGFIFHFIGDYLFQNNWMANKKTSNNWVAILHAVLYSILFYFIVGYSTALSVIFITHYFIDRHRLSVYWIKLVNWNWKSTNFGYNDNTPKWLSTWLMIIIDNIFHIVINTLAIYYLT